MLLNKNEQEGKLGVLGEISKMLAAKDHEMIGKKRKPVAAEVSVSTLEPKDALGEEMAKAGHEGVENEEEKLFPGEEAKEDALETGGEKMLGATTPSPEDLMKIKELYDRFFGGK